MEGEGAQFFDALFGPKPGLFPPIIQATIWQKWLLLIVR